MPERPDAAVDAREPHEPIGDPALEAMARAVLPPPRRWARIGLTLAVVVVIAAGSIALIAEHRSNVRSGLPRIEAHSANELQASLAVWADKDRDQRVVAISGALARLEKGRIPEALRTALTRIGEVPRHTRRDVLARALRDPAVAAIWHDTCPKAARAFAETAGMEPSASSMHVFRRCELHRFKLLSATEIVSTDAVCVILAHMLWDYLERRRALTDVEAQALRLMSAGGTQAARAWPNNPR